MGYAPGAPPGAAARSRRRRRGVRDSSEMAERPSTAYGVGVARAHGIGRPGWREAHVGFAGVVLRWRSHRQFKRRHVPSWPSYIQWSNSARSLGPSPRVAANNTASSVVAVPQRPWLRQDRNRAMLLCWNTSPGRPFIAHVRPSLIPFQLCGEVRRVSARRRRLRLTAQP